MPDRKPLAGLFFNPGDEGGCVIQPAALSCLEQAIGHVFTDQSLLVKALTHSTYAYEHRQKQLDNNERLEFLGDAVLDLAISDALFRQPGSHPEGHMTKIRALVVRETTLAQLAQFLDLGTYLLLGKGEETTGGRDKQSNLANAAEAVFGALYLDAGFAKASRVIQHLLAEPLELALSGDLIYDYKSRLLELVQATRGGSVLRFQILDESGPVHERVFTAGVLVDDQLVATGQGCSKKEAEQQAAQTALVRLSCDRQNCIIQEDIEE